jgi:hypothetical protein
VEKDLARMRAALSPPSVAPPESPKKRPTNPLVRHWQTIWSVALALFLIVVIGSAYKNQADRAARVPPFYLSEPPTTADPEPAAKPANPAKPQPETPPEETSGPSDDPAVGQEPPNTGSSEDDAATVSGLGEIRPEARPAPAATALESEHSALKQDLGALKELIDVGKLQLTLQKKRLDADDAAIDEEQAAIDGLSSSLRQAKADLEKYERDSPSGLEADQEAYQRALDLHQTLVDRYNERLPGFQQRVARRNELSEQYHKRLQKHNRLVDEYNQKLTKLSGGG